VPGGFLCDACAIDAPAPVARATAPAEAPRSSTRGLVLVALLYVVGATTFLLVRELNRQAPQAQAPRADYASASDVAAIAKKLDDVEAQARRAHEDLKANDLRQDQDAHEQSLAFHAHAQEFAKFSAEVKGRLDDLDSMAKALATKTQLVRDEVEAARNELRQLRGEPPTVKTTPEPPVVDLPPTPERSPEEMERDRLAAEYIAKLADKKQPNTVRYNAAYSLGELRHPAGIRALVDALQNDPYDLVCRAAAWSLGMYGKDAVSAIPALIEQLGGKDGTVGYMCERALGEITKAATGTAVSFGYDSNATQRARKKTQKDWEDWWEKNRSQLLPGAG
jgi:HEAT repeat protein